MFSMAKKVRSLSRAAFIYRGASQLTALSLTTEGALKSPHQPLAFKSKDNHRHLYLLEAMLSHVAGRLDLLGKYNAMCITRERS